MKELKRVQVHPVHRHDEQVDNLVLIGRRDRHHQAEERDEIIGQTAVVGETE